MIQKEWLASSPSLCKESKLHEFCIEHSFAVGAFGLIVTNGYRKFYVEKLLLHIISIESNGIVYPLHDVVTVITLCVWYFDLNQNCCRVVYFNLSTLMQC